ncbi:MAG: DUF2059 domain-containing protein [Litoreibacter sp.]
MKILLPLFLCVSLTSPTFAQDEALRAAATGYIDTPVQQELMNQILSPESMITQLRARGLPEDKATAAAAIISDETNSIRDELREAMINGLAENFSLEEIIALTEFYSSPVGASAIAKLQPYMTQTMTTLTPSLQAMQERIQQRLRTELQP